MKRRGRASGSSRKAVLPKARKASMVRVLTTHVQEQLDHALRERDEALEQLAATSEVLQSSAHRAANLSLCSKPCWKTRCAFARPSSARSTFTTAVPSARLPILSVRHLHLLRRASTSRGCHRRQTGRLEVF